MKNIVLGLCLSETQAQAVLAEQNTSSTTVIATAEWSNTLFDYAGDDTPGVDDFVEHLSRFLSPHRTTATPSVSVALDSSLLFINTIPLASTVSRSEIDEQLLWELQAYYPGSPKDNFISDFHILMNPIENDWDAVLMVSARRDLVRTLHHSLARLKFRLEVVDVDHFGAETALRYNHGDTATKRVALLGVKPQRLDVSFIRYTDLDTYRYYVPGGDEDVVDRIAQIVSAEQSLAGIIMYGEISSELLERAKEAAKIPLHLLNPIRNVNLAESVNTNTSFLSHPYRYAAAVGAALRRD